MMKRALSYRLVACAVVVILTLTTVNAYAEQPLRNDLSREAFLRGGGAISDALREAASPNAVAAAELLPSEAPRPAMPSLPQETKNRRVMLWVGLAITGTIAVYLIQRSVRNHGKIFGDNAR
jgi:hypothetical protein